MTSRRKTTKTTKRKTTDRVRTPNKPGAYELNVKCPACGVNAGTLCQRHFGDRSTEIHAKRVAEYQRVKQEADNVTKAASLTPPMTAGA